MICSFFYFLTLIYNLSMTFRRKIKAISNLPPFWLTIRLNLLSILFGDRSAVTLIKEHIVFK